MSETTELIAQQILNGNINKRTWGDIIYNVKVYGAKGDNSTNDAPFINSAINAATTDGGGEVRLPPGTYIVDSPVLTNDKVLLRGSGRGNTTIKVRLDNVNAIEVNGIGCAVEDVKIIYSGSSPTAGAGIFLKTGAFATIESCQIENFYYGMNVQDAYSWSLEDSYIVNCVKYGVYVRNTALGDTGDQVISGCTFDSAVGTDAAIRHESGGGLKVTGNKILRHKIGYDLQVADGVSTSITILDGNSIEMQSDRHIRLGRLGTTGTYDMIHITDNQHNYMVSITEGVLVGPGINDVVISGNISAGPGDKTYINLTGGTDILIEGNKLNGWKTGIDIASAVVGATVGFNAFEDVATPVKDATTNLNVKPSNIIHRYVKKVSVTDTVNFTNFFKIDMNTYRGCKIDVIIEGTIQGVGSAARYIQKIINREATACNVTAVADTAAGGTVDVQFDPATTSGSVYVQIRRNAGAGGTSFDGTVSLMINGSIAAVNIL